MNHVAFDVAPEKIDEYRERLVAKGIEVTEVVNHADSLDGGHLADWETGDPDVFVRSIYFTDPNQIRLEFAALTRVFTEADVAHQGKYALDREAAGAPASG